MKKYLSLFLIALSPILVQASEDAMDDEEMSQVESYMENDVAMESIEEQQPAAPVIQKKSKRSKAKARQNLTQIQAEEQQAPAAKQRALPRKKLKKSKARTYTRQNLTQTEDSYETEAQQPAAKSRMKRSPVAESDEYADEVAPQKSTKKAKMKQKRSAKKNTSQQRQKLMQKRKATAKAHVEAEAPSMHPFTAPSDTEAGE